MNLDPGNDDLLTPSLLELLSQTGTEGLILAGGFGLRVKQASLEASGAVTLIPPVPAIRPTTDLDVFLRMEVLSTPEEQGRLRDAIDALGYVPAQANWQFRKPYGPPFPDREVTLDLLARYPISGEEVRLRPPRVGDGVLHGRGTPEAFAVEVAPLTLFGDRHDAEWSDDHDAGLGAAPLRVAVYEGTGGPR